ncbi:MAG: hypothetical protein RL757_1529 [Bacteroidota bacterium]|jgi:hypothetical protein
MTSTPYSFFYNLLMSQQRTKTKNKNKKNLVAKIKQSQQQILLNQDGYIIESSDTIFSTQALRHRPITEWSMFLASFFDEIRNMKLDSPEILVNRVETITDFISGKLFDCSFMRVEWNDSDSVFVWTIFDYPTEIFKTLQMQQQFVNNQIIWQQRNFR